MHYDFICNPLHFQSPLMLRETESLPWLEFKIRACKVMMLLLRCDFFSLELKLNFGGRKIANTNSVAAK